MLRAPRAFLLAAAFVCRASAQRAEFEVASIKPDTSGLLDLRGPQRSGTSVTMRHTSVYNLVVYAFRIDGTYGIAGFPDIPDSWSYVDIEARTSVAADDEQVRAMFRSLLEDRFNLKVHRETRVQERHTLTVAKSGAKMARASEGPMKVSIEGRSLDAPTGRCFTTLWTSGTLTLCHAVPMATFVAELSRMMKAPVADATGLSGEYDVNLLFLPEGRRLEENAPPTPILKDAIQERLGLKIASEKGPVEVLVVDHIEKPTEN